MDSSLDTATKDRDTETAQVLRAIRGFANLAEAQLIGAVWHRCKGIAKRLDQLNGYPVQWEHEDGIEEAARDIVTLVDAHGQFGGFVTSTRPCGVTIETLRTAELDALLQAECKRISTAEEDWEEYELGVGEEISLGDVKDSAIRIAMLRQAYLLSNS